MTRPDRAEDVWVDISFIVKVRLRKADLPPLQGGAFLKPVPGVKTPGLVLLPLRGSSPQQRSFAENQRSAGMLSS